MADTDKPTDSNKTMQREQGHSGQREEGKGGCCGSDSDSDREQGQSGQRDQGGSDKERQEKSAIGGGEMSGPSGQMSGQNKEFDKNRSEPTSR